MSLQIADLDPYLERLRALPFVERVEVRLPRRSETRSGDAWLTLRTRKGRHDLIAEVKGAPLSRGGARSLVAQAARPPVRPRVVFSPYVSSQVGQLLASHHIGYVDQAGNCHIALGRDYVALIEGRRQQQPARLGRGLGARSYQVLFALLARPELVAAPVRSLAAAAGVRKTAGADLLQRLTEEGLVVRDKAGRRIARPNALLDRWVAGYADKLRPRLLVGRYRTGKDPLAFEKHAEATLEGLNWAWGGATAAFRLTRHYRNAATTVHVASPSPAMQRQLGLLPAKDGPVVVLGVPGPLGLESPLPHIAHPLLVYTELLVEGDERALEAASEIRSRFLGHIG
jgi:hypothetical protein